MGLFCRISELSISVIPINPRNITVFPSDEPSSRGHSRLVTKASTKFVTRIIKDSNIRIIPVMIDLVIEMLMFLMFIMEFLLWV